MFRAEQSTICYAIYQQRKAGYDNFGMGKGEDVCKSLASLVGLFTTSLILVGVSTAVTTSRDNPYIAIVAGPCVGLMMSSIIYLSDFCKKQLQPEYGWSIPLSMIAGEIGCIAGFMIASQKGDGLGAVAGGTTMALSMPLLGGSLRLFSHYLQKPSIQGRGIEGVQGNEGEIAAPIA